MKRFALIFTVFTGCIAGEPGGPDDLGDIPRADPLLCDPTGTYEALSTRIDGDCPETPPRTYSVSIYDDPDWGWSLATDESLYQGLALQPECRIVGASREIRLDDLPTCYVVFDLRADDGIYGDAWVTQASGCTDRFSVRPAQ